jgi:GNAT superfamily N-acetyltransferase
VDIRPARAEDLPRLQEVERLAGAMFRDVGMPEIADDVPPSIEELAAAAAVFVAVDHDDQPVGYARIEVVDGHAHLEQLSVIPEHGGRGVGTALLDAVAAWAADRGDEEITLTTFRHVAFNAPLYARRGYVELTDDERGPELVALMATEAEHGLDPADRVAMRRLL